MPLSETVRTKLVLLQSSFLHVSLFSSLWSLIRISPSSLPGNACLRELEMSSLTIIPNGTAVSISKNDVFFQIHVQVDIFATKSVSLKKVFS